MRFLRRGATEEDSTSRSSDSGPGGPTPGTPSPRTSRRARSPAEPARSRARYLPWTSDWPGSWRPARRRSTCWWSRPRAARRSARSRSPGSRPPRRPMRPGSTARPASPANPERSWSAARPWSCRRCERGRRGTGAASCCRSGCGIRVRLHARHRAPPDRVPVPGQRPGRGRRRAMDRRDRDRRGRADGRHARGARQRGAPAGRGGDRRHWALAEGADALGERPHRALQRVGSSGSIIHSPTTTSR